MPAERQHQESFRNLTRAHTNLSASTMLTTAQSCDAIYGLDVTVAAAKKPSLSRARSRRPEYKCPVASCNKVFKRRFSLKEHVTTHTGDKAFVCSVSSCGRSFSTSGNLARHKRMQHPWLDVPLECLVSDCHCEFATERQLERHMAMVHFSTTAFSCQVPCCGRAFSTAGNLRRHMKQRHAGLEAANEAKESTPRVQSPVVVDLMHLESEEPVDFSHRLHPHMNVGLSFCDAELLDVLSCLFD